MRNSQSRYGDSISNEAAINIRYDEIQCDSGFRVVEVKYSWASIPPVWDQTDTAKTAMLTPPNQIYRYTCRAVDEMTDGSLKGRRVVDIVVGLQRRKEDYSCAARDCRSRPSRLRNYP